MARNQITTSAHDLLSKTGKRSHTTLTQRSWYGMRARCYDPKHDNYRHYGGRGLGICIGWRDNYKQFLTDNGERPSVEHTIDRPDNNSGYRCGYCEECLQNGWTRNGKWATRNEQSNNKRNCHYLTVNGETHTIMEWARIRHMNFSTLSQRLAKGWSEHDAVMRPLRRHPARPESLNSL